ncbi:hypothetical protein IJJ97_01770, partial [bacterium]|nr:hypothetical protein [bacterium]
KEQEKELINSQYFCLLYAKLSEDLNNIEKAIELYKKINSKETKTKIEILSNIGNIDKILELSDKYPDNTDIYKYAFKKAIELKDNDKLEKITDKLIKSDIIKTKKDTSISFGAMLLTSRFFELSKKILENEELKNIESSLFFQTIVYLQEKNPVEGEKRIREAIKLNPTNTTYIEYLILFLYENKKYEEFIEQTKNIFKILDGENILDEHKITIAQNMILVKKFSEALKVLNSITTENETVKKMKEQCLENR